MLKKPLISLVAVLLFIYLLFTVFFLNPFSEKDLVCKEIQVNIVDTLDRHYMNNTDIVNSLTQAGLSPVGKKMSSVNTAEIEEKLKENRLIKRAECYKTMNGTVRVKIYQRIPILRVFSTKGNYYVDNEREIMPIPWNFAAYVPIASGYIEEEFAKNQLYEFVLFLQEDKFWNSQIKQIYVAANRDIELTPAVGSHQIILGEIENYKENLGKLRLFYEKGLSKVGWNKYSIINLRYKNQVVCTRKEI